LDAVRAAVAAGAVDLGENRAQELRQKHAVLKDGVRWHFIGHLQTNKVRSVVGAATLIHSVDRFGLAEAISRRARSQGWVQRVLVEVNVSGESSKGGVEPARAGALAEEISALDGLEVGGFMTMAPYSESPEASRPYFSDLRDLAERLRHQLPSAEHLSMGMSGDFEVAVEEGATIVRVGTAVFGPRSL
jgi:pyridoxal phosphate enzyme (YggS family)